jgi:hypothetical protein
MDITAKSCLECGDPVGKGRIDRKFCSVECKNKYHNKEAYAEKIETARIKKILNKNRKILKKMAARKDAEQIHKERLLKEGFEFDYHTHFKISKVKKYQYTFCFDYGYRELNGTYEKKDHYKVVKGFAEKED